MTAWRKAAEQHKPEMASDREQAQEKKRHNAHRLHYRAGLQIHARLEAHSFARFCSMPASSVGAQTHLDNLRVVTTTTRHIIDIIKASAYKRRPAMQERLGSLEAGADDVESSSAYTMSHWAVRGAYTIVLERTGMAWGCTSALWLTAGTHAIQQTLAPKPSCSSARARAPSGSQAPGGSRAPGGSQLRLWAHSCDTHRIAN